MPTIRKSLAIACLVLLSLALALPALAQPTSGGAYAMPEYDANCSIMDGVTERNYPGFTPDKQLSFAFFSDKGEYPDMCLTTLVEPGGEWLGTLAFLIRSLDGMPLEELTEPLSVTTAPLEACWPKHFQFEDFNGDGHTDILMLIGCYNGEADRPQNDNAVYLSSIREGSVWLQQSEAVNKAVAAYTDPAEASAAVRKTLGQSSGQATTAKPTPPSSPPPPPPSSPPPSPGASPGTSPGASPGADIDTCKYNTEWGEVTLKINYTAGTVTGSYPYQTGRLQGVHKDNVSTGTWTQSDGSGNFDFRHSKWGFQGVWNAMGDKKWRGEWNGQIVQCW